MFENGFFQDVRARSDKELVKGNLFRAIRSHDIRGRVQGDQRGRCIGRVDDVAQFTLENRVVLVLAGHGETKVAALFVARKVRAAEVPAARTLHDVTADRTNVANTWRGRRNCGGCQPWIVLLNIGRLGDGGQGSQRA